MNPALLAIVVTVALFPIVLGALRPQRCQYEPGDVIVAWTESRPAFSKKVQHRVIDAALGTVEKGWYHNDDAYNEQPWLPNGPIPHTVTWTRPGYVAPGRRPSRQRWSSVSPDVEAR